MYDADVPATIISKMTEEIIEQVTEWQYRPLDTYLPDYLFGLHCRQNTPEQACYQQSRLSRSGCQHGWPQRITGPMAVRIELLSNVVYGILKRHPVFDR
jgi:hypothetical protein